MPYRYFTREQDWLLPPSLGELLPAEHPARFVAEYVDLLDLAKVGIAEQPAVEGAPGYHPKQLLAVWLYGFMVQVRSSRKLETACGERIPFMWLAGGQRPDHTTLARFYQAHRGAMRELLKQTVQTALEVGLIDLVLQAVDGSRVAVAHCSSLRDQAAVERLLAQVVCEISAMEQVVAGEAAGEAAAAPSVQALTGKRALRERLQQALAVLQTRAAERGEDAVAPQPAGAGPAAAGSAAPASGCGATPAPPVATGSGAADLPALVSETALADARRVPTAVPALTNEVRDGQAEPATAAALGAEGGPAMRPAPDSEPLAAQPAAAASGAEGGPALRPGPDSEPLAVPPAAAAKSPTVSPTDPYATVQKGRHGLVVGYNGQVVVDSKQQLVVAADITRDAHDYQQLRAMLAEAAALTGQPVPAAVADSGYFVIDEISAVEAQGTQLFVSDPRNARRDGPAHNPYHKAHFVYDPDSDTFTCPQGRVLQRSDKTICDGKPAVRYRACDCRACPAQQNQACTKAHRRSLTVFGNEAQLHSFTSKMATAAAQHIIRRRKAVVEPVFAVLREQLGLVRFLLRGPANVRAEWQLLCVAHNLRKLWRFWWQPQAVRTRAAT